MKPLMQEPLDMVITGVGGQGNVLASQVLGRALLNKGYSVTVGETYGLSQRGGAVMSQVRVSRGRVLGPLIPEHAADIILGLEPMETLRVMAEYAHPEVLVFSNDRPLLPINVTSGAARYPDTDELKDSIEELCARLFWLPATDIAMELGAPILANVVMLGTLAVSGYVPLSLADLENALAEIFPPEKMEVNARALKRGRDLLVT